jgi:purine-nucleoside phosphorylase
MSLYDSLQATAELLRERTGGRKPLAALVLGSGLGEFADRLEDPVRVPYSEIPGFPRSNVKGHAGQLVFGRAPATRLEVVAMQGRVHCYEGHSVADVVYPIRTLVTLGARSIILTNAAGGCNPSMTGGELVLVRDHLNLTGRSPLEGENDDRIGPRFPDLSSAYDPGLRRVAQATAARVIGGPLREGVYAWLLGPSYETPAEVRMARTLGADLVGMSTVPETIAAVHMGARVMALSCVTNLAAGISSGPLSHDEVMETAAKVRTKFLGLVAGVLSSLEAA